MTNVSVVEKISELMQQIEVNSPRVAALHYCLSEAARHIAELEQKLAESQREFRAADATIENLQMQVEKLAAENTGLKAGASYFSYGSEHNFEWHKTAEEAVESAEAAIDDYRGDACDGWSEEVDSICWGIIMQSSTKVGERPRNEDDRCDPAIDTICDYALLPNIETPTTDTFLADVMAQGVERLANAWYAIANETDPGISISDSSRLKYRQRADDAADFANEIRQEAAQ
ncbi:hypothetical protein P5M00_07140 [Enterobacter asburiae]|uniref:hypothetical protein n=1 Tax=Enterobacter asburiae TaxID=61645 RepID=UPI002966F69E|nr:hypothetical protein [Enterobacter asburiae]MDW3573948.1 hypothetical protein [Enterobacter asburiae]